MSTKLLFYTSYNSIANLYVPSVCSRKQIHIIQRHVQYTDSKMTYAN